MYRIIPYDSTRNECFKGDVVTLSKTRERCSVGNDRFLVKTLDGRSCGYTCNCFVDSWPSLKGTYWRKKSPSPSVFKILNVIEDGIQSFGDAIHYYKEHRYRTSIKIEHLVVTHLHLKN